MPPKALPKDGDKVFVVNDTSFEITEETVRSAPSECLWVGGKGKVSMVFVGPRRWATTKAEAKTKALALATNRRAELTDKLAVIDAAIKKLGGK